MDRCLSEGVCRPAAHRSARWYLNSETRSLSFSSAGTALPGSARSSPFPATPAAECGQPGSFSSGSPACHGNRRGVGVVDQLAGSGVLEYFRHHGPGLRDRIAPHVAEVGNGVRAAVGRGTVHLLNAGVFGKRAVRVEACGLSGVHDHKIPGSEERDADYSSSMWCCPAPPVTARGPSELVPVRGKAGPRYRGETCAG